MHFNRILVNSSADNVYNACICNWFIVLSMHTCKSSIYMFLDMQRLKIL